MAHKQQMFLKWQNGIWMADKQFFFLLTELTHWSWQLRAKRLAPFSARQLFVWKCRGQWGKAWDGCLVTTWSPEEWLSDLRLQASQTGRQSSCSCLVVDGFKWSVQTKSFGDYVNNNNNNNNDNHYNDIQKFYILLLFTHLCYNSYSVMVALKHRG